MNTSRASERWPVFGIVSAFWVYVTLSNVLFAGSMNAGFRPMIEQRLFATWDVRVLQHVFLYPALLLSVWTSLRIRWQPWWPAVPMQLLVALAFSALGSPALMAADLLGGHEEVKHSPGAAVMAMLSSSDLQLWLASATTMFLAYGFGLALVTGFANYRRFRDSQSHIASLERQFDAARLAALRMQLSPHTLFNLLHAIHAEIEWQPREAQAMVVKLGDLLRRLLRAGKREYVTLADELQFVRLYLELQQKRFADRLHIELPEAKSVPAVWVPSLILQPLVENAVVHGLARAESAVSILVQAQLDGEQLRLTVSNGASASAGPHGEGIGIKNVRERLAVQFGERARFTSQRGDAAHWIAEIVIPALRDAAPSSAGHVSSSLASAANPVAVLNA